VHNRRWFHDFLTINLKLWDMTSKAYCFSPTIASRDLTMSFAYKHIGAEDTSHVKGVGAAIVMVETDGEFPLVEAQQIRASLEGGLPTVVLFNKVLSFSLRLFVERSKSC